MGASLIAFHERRVANDIESKDNGKFPFQRCASAEFSDHNRTSASNLHHQRSAPNRCSLMPKFARHSRQELSYHSAPPELQLPAISNPDAIDSAAGGITRHGGGADSDPLNAKDRQGSKASLGKLSNL
jgi:hypothetical protein